MKARSIVEVETSPLAAFMAQATQEILANDKALVFGGKRGKVGRRPVDGYDLNCGFCEDWAERVAELYREATGRDDVEVLEPYNLTGDPEDELAGHVFIRFQGRFYDAESPQGVDDWRQLPLFVNNARL